MKFVTFYKTYYLHRVKKASNVLKFIIFLTLPFNYLINKILYPSKINLDEFSFKNKYLYNKNLEYLFQYFNSDKGKFFINQYDKPIKKKNKLIDGHSYHIFYEQFFSSLKEKKLKILEIGAFKGNATAAFYFYFKNSSFLSCDIYPDFFLYKSKRIDQLKIDNSSEIQLQEKILGKCSGFDIIVEDAGHYLKDQIISLFFLFEKLNSGGIFVIEELDFPDTRDDMNINNEKITLKKILNLIIENKDFNSKYIPKKHKEYFLENFKDIKIYKGNFNEIAFITKK